MIDKKALRHYLGKKVFIVLKDDPKPQVGILMLKDNSYFLTSGNNYLSVIDSDAITRITSEELDPECISQIFSNIISKFPLNPKERK